MEKKEILEELILILKELQKNSGEEEVVITKDTKPFNDLPGFDSLRLVESLATISNKSGCKFNGNEIELTASREKNEMNTILDIAGKIEKIINKK